jgi:hypothetical protein
MGIGFLTKIFAVAPIVVAGVEKVFGSLGGVAKATRAIELIKVFVPFLSEDEDEKAVDELSEGLAEIISGIVKVYHAYGVFKHKEVVE